MSFLDAFRKPLDRLGYLLLRRDFIRYGFDPYLDVKRFASGQSAPVRTIFDVGANVGQTAREVLAAFPAANVHSFEPHPRAFAVLNGINNARLSAHQLAFGPKAGEVTMYEYAADGTGSHRNSLIDDAPSTAHFKGQAKEIKVPCMTIDAFCAENGIDQIDLLKIDVEGFELSVLQSARGMFERGKVRFVYAEFNDLMPFAGKTGGALLPLAEYLAPFGMRFIATYTDFVSVGGLDFTVANVLWALEPRP